MYKLTAQHAEYKAIASYKGKETLRGCALYVTTAPCNICAKLIAQSGIVEVIFMKNLENKIDQEITDVQIISEDIFKKCSIKFE